MTRNLISAAPSRTRVADLDDHRFTRPDPGPDPPCLLEPRFNSRVEMMYTSKQEAITTCVLRVSPVPARPTMTVVKNFERQSGFLRVSNPLHGGGESERSVLIGWKM